MGNLARGKLRPNFTLISVDRRPVSCGGDRLCHGYTEVIKSFTLWEETTIDTPKAVDLFQEGWEVKGQSIPWVYNQHRF